MVSCLPFYIIPRSIWDRCPISWWNSNTLSWNVCGCCQEMGALGLFALWGIVSYRKRYQIGCVGVEYRFKRNIYTSILSRAHVSSSPQFACQLCFVHTIPLSGGWTLPWSILNIRKVIYFQSHFISLLRPFLNNYSFCFTMVGGLSKMKKIMRKWRAYMA